VKIQEQDVEKDACRLRHCVTQKFSSNNLAISLRLGSNGRYFVFEKLFGYVPAILHL